MTEPRLNASVTLSSCSEASSLPWSGPSSTPPQPAPPTASLLAAPGCCPRSAPRPGSQEQRAHAAALAAGSLIAITHLTADQALGPVTSAADAFNARVPVQVCPRSLDQVTALFGELGRQWPGVVPVTLWRPAFEEAPGRACDMYGRVAVVPTAGQLPSPGAAGERAAS